MPPGIFKKPSDIFEEKSNAQCRGYNDLYEITTAAGIDV